MPARTFTGGGVGVGVGAGCGFGIGWGFGGAISHCTSAAAECLHGQVLRTTRGQTLRTAHGEGGPTGIAGSGAGGGCGVGLGLGWGYGSALGAHYIVVKPEFEKDLAVKPMWRKKLDNALSHVPIPFPGKPAREV